MSKIEIGTTLENAENLFNLLRQVGYYDLILFKHFDDNEMRVIDREIKTDFKNVTNEKFKIFCQQYKAIPKIIDQLHKAYDPKVTIQSFRKFVNDIREDYKILDDISSFVSNKRNALKSGASKEQKEHDNKIAHYKRAVSQEINKYDTQSCSLDRDIEYRIIKKTVKDRLDLSDDYMNKMYFRELIIRYFKLCSIDI